LRQLNFVLSFILILSCVAAVETARPVVIKVYSIPGGASLWIDGQNTNRTTPCMISLVFDYDDVDNIITKQYKLLIDGYIPYNGTIRGPQDSTIDVVLQPLPN
jgi:hypothetical protein